jgi:hypothetical protein
MQPEWLKRHKTPLKKYHGEGMCKESPSSGIKFIVARESLCLQVTLDRWKSMAQKRSEKNFGKSHLLYWWDHVRVTYPMFIATVRISLCRRSEADLDNCRLSQPVYDTS